MNIHGEMAKEYWHDYWNRMNMMTEIQPPRMCKKCGLPYEGITHNCRS